MASKHIFGDYLANLAAELTAHVLTAIPLWVKSSWKGKETDAAVRRCLSAGIIAFMRHASTDTHIYTELWELIFPHFFQDEQVATQIARLLEGQNLNKRALQFMATNAGYQPDRFPTFNFAIAIGEFEGAFLIQATQEPTLKGIINTAIMLQQTELLTETQVLLTEIVKLLQETRLQQIDSILANSITATNVISGDKHIYQLAPESLPTRFSPHWESHYLHALIAHCDGLDITSLSASEATSDPLSLTAVFTIPFLENVTRGENETIVDVLSPRQQKEWGPVRRNGEWQIEKDHRPITAIEAIDAMPRLVILGQPSSGKSSLVNYVATQLARQRLGNTNAHLPNWPAGKQPLPVRITLHRFANWMAVEKRTGSAGDVWDYLAYLLTRWGCADSLDGLRYTLIKFGGILFFDGLDEIREASVQLKIIKGAVIEFANIEKQCQVVVTSRPYAYIKEAQWHLSDNRFSVVTLSSFTDEQIKTFTTAWYTRVIGPRRGWDTAQCQQWASLLIRTLLNQPHLRSLAASPLLLTLMAQVHSQGGTLPDNRSELYRQTVNLQLSRWENRIVLDTQPSEDIQADEVLWLGVPASHLRDVLAQVAYQAHKRQGEQADRNDRNAAEISRDELKLALVERFDSGKQADQIMTYIQYRAGLLLAQSESSYVFTHRTFQEYLAAQYFLSKSDGLELLCKQVKERPDWWREVFLLSAGSSSSLPANVQDLVNTLLPFDPSRAMPLTPETASQVSLAAQALQETNFQYYVGLEELPGGYSAVYHRVQAWLETIMTTDNLLPVKIRAEAGRWSAKLGDERPGVGVDPETGWPDIVWGGEVPAGTYQIGDTHDKCADENVRDVVIKHPYRLSRYPITNAQFQCFIDASDWNKSEWWEGLTEGEKIFSNSEFTYANHPRENVSWFQAIAFCRWLRDKLDIEVDLPHEYEWEVAARYPDGCTYPWGNEFDPNKANTKEGDIGQATAVGIYPSGKNSALELYDLSGNVLEWCVNKHAKPEEDVEDDSSNCSVLRGGSWFTDHLNARTTSRNYYRSPSHKNIGFRVIVRRPPEHLRQERILHWEVRQFLIRAGLNITEAPNGYLAVGTSALWRRFSPFYVCIIHNHVLDIAAFQELLETIAEIEPNLSSEQQLAIVIIDRPPRPGDLHHIFAIQAQQDLTIVPLPRSLLAQAQLNAQEAELLSTQIQTYTGQVDLYSSQTAAVSDVLSFFGRSGILSELKRRLANGKSQILFGMRKVGKSSLLYRLREELDWPISHIDLEWFTPQDSIATVYEEALRGWYVSLQSASPHILLPVSLQADWMPNETNPSQFFRRTIGELLTLLSDQPEQPGLLLFLDEMDALYKHPDYLELAATLHSIAENARWRGRFALIMAGLNPSLNRTDRMHDGRNPFFSFFGEIPLGPLNLEDAHSMIISIGGQMGVVYDEDSLDLLLEAGGGHPFLTRQLCSSTIEGLERPCRISLAQAEKGIADYLRRPENFLAESLWNIKNGGPAPIEAQMLKSLATAQPQSEISLIPNHLSPPEQYVYRQALASLQDRSLAQRDGDNWRISFTFYRRWIRRYILNLEALS